MREMTRSGYLRDSETGKFKKEILVYNEPDRLNEISGFGTPISLNVAQQLVRHYWDELSSLPENGKKSIAFTFGKDAILSILAQIDCVAIRFYYAKKVKEDFEGSVMPENGEGETLIAVGVESDNSDIGADDGNKYIVSSFAPTSTVENDHRFLPEDGLICEMVPPLTIEKSQITGNDYLVAGAVDAGGSLQEVINNFFTKK